MSLTSYRTAPPRVKPVKILNRELSGLVKRAFRCLLLHALGRPGGDLLSHALRRSTIGAEGFHGRVRDGIGWGTLAITTRSSKQMPATGRRLPASRVLCLLPIRRPTLRAYPCARARLKPIEPLVPVSYTRYRASTPGLSTWWSTTALKGELVSREASRLDAFSGYPVRT